MAVEVEPESALKKVEGSGTEELCEKPLLLKTEGRFETLNFKNKLKNRTSNAIRKDVWVEI